MAGGGAGSNDLTVWLYGQRVALIERHRGRPRLTYTSEALSRYPLGTPGIAQAAASPDSLEKLLRATAVNVLLGNGDAHGKNFSLLHHPDGSLTLAPLYDLMCTLYYGDSRLAMYVDDVQRTDRVSAKRLANEAMRWGLSRARATATIEDLLSRAPEAIELARDATPGLPAELITTVEGQLARLTSAS